MKCPVCKDPDLVMSDRQGVEIDYCPRCRGVWLDRGELDKIIERSEQVESRQSPPGERREERREERYDERYEKKPYRPKSFWRELFD